MLGREGKRWRIKKKKEVLAKEEGGGEKRRKEKKEEEGGVDCEGRFSRCHDLPLLCVLHFSSKSIIWLWGRKKVFT